MNPPLNLLISFRFGTHRWEHLNFEHAVDIVSRALKAEEDAYFQYQRDVRADQWFASAISDIFDRSSPPSDEMWSAAKLAIVKARQAHLRGDEKLAETSIKQAVDKFNDVHRSFYAYRNGKIAGGERAITTLEIVIAVSAAVFSAGASGIGLSLVRGAVASGGLAMAQQTAKNISAMTTGFTTRWSSRPKRSQARFSGASRTGRSQASTEKAAAKGTAQR